MESSDELKRQVGQVAASLISDGMVLGLGTGSTVQHLLAAIADRRGRGELARIVGIPTSEDTRERARDLDIPLGDLDSHPEVDLALDGADQVDPSLDLIKGLGGALLREKIVVSASHRFIVMVDASKQVDRLGRGVPLPVEIDPFSRGMQIPFLESLGCEVRLRRSDDGGPYQTDGGNLILDCEFADGIADATALAAALDSRPGVLEHGLFLGSTERVLVASDLGVEVLERRARST